MVRAKFKVYAIEASSWGGDKKLVTVKLRPVTSGSPENKAFYEASPSGDMTLGTLNEEASKQFSLNQEFYVDFTPAE